MWVYKRAVPVTTTLQRTTKPLVLGNKIILGFADGFVGALSFNEGTIIWETKIVDQSKFIDVDLNPLLSGGVVITGSPSGELKAINPDNGAVARSFGFSILAHPALKGEQLLLGTNEGEVLLINQNGDILKKVKISDKAVSAVVWWKENIAEFAMGYDYSAVFSDMIVSEDFLVIYSSRNRLYLFH